MVTKMNREIYVPVDITKTTSGSCKLSQMHPLSINLSPRKIVKSTEAPCTLPMNNKEDATQSRSWSTPTIEPGETLGSVAFVAVSMK